jgi:type IV secretory pathway VirD2 relaxase
MPVRMYSESGTMFDLASYARRGPGRRDRLLPTELQQIARTVERTPEVMVKVLSKGAGDLAAVRKHIDYIGRKGELGLETDDGNSLRGREVGEELLDDWDLELDEQRSKADLVARPGSRPLRLVHKLMFSMPAGTPPEKVLGAVRNFFREEFALKHRYVLALHTDVPHPHVHVVLKAVSEQGERLHIHKMTLRAWRAGFARHLRALGVPANATERQVRGETTPRKSDGIYRAGLRGESTHMRERAESVARELEKGDLRVELAKARLVETRKEIQNAWQTVGDILICESQPDLAAQVRRFIDHLPAPITEREWWAARLLERAHSPPARGSPTR